MPLPEYAICANITPSKNLAHGPGVSSTYDVCSTVDGIHRVVHMEGSNIPGTNIKTTETERAKDGWG